MPNGSYEPTEPHWLENDIEAVLEYQREQDLLCPGCGNPMDQTMDPEAQGKAIAHAIRCHYCAEKELKEKEFLSHPHASGEGLRFYVEAPR
jgi:hypothetical protein